MASSADSPLMSMIYSVELLNLPMVDSSQLSTASVVTVPDGGGDEFLDNRMLVDRLLAMDTLKERKQSLSELNSGGTSAYHILQ